MTPSELNLTEPERKQFDVLAHQFGRFTGGTLFTYLKAKQDKVRALEISQQTGTYSGALLDVLKILEEYEGG